MIIGTYFAPVLLRATAASARCRFHPQRSQNGLMVGRKALYIVIGAPQRGQVIVRIILILEALAVAMHTSGKRLA
jgi:hypothetical protein